MEWISVNDRLPKDEQSVLGIHENLKISVPRTIPQCTGQRGSFQMVT